MKYLILFLNLIFCSYNCYAIREARPTPTDPRIRVLAYKPDDVIKYTGYYNYLTSIKFSDNEEISSIYMGDISGWHIEPHTNRLFIKPIEKNADTNMTIITNVKNSINPVNNTETQRLYFFELYAKETDNIRDPDMVFNINFLYGDEEENKTVISNHHNASSKGVPDLSHPEKYNFNYSLSGDEEISPIKVYDDGEFTYLQFRDKNTELPAIFAVDEKLRESMLNFRVMPDNIVVLEQVFKKLALKNGKKISCLFNEAFNPF